MSFITIFPLFLIPEPGRAHHLAMTWEEVADGSAHEFLFQSPAGWRLCAEGKVIRLPKRPVGWVAREVLDWIGESADNKLLSKLTSERIRCEAVRDLGELVRREVDRAESLPIEQCLETVVLAASLFAVGWGDALPTTAKSRHTLLQTWRHVFLLTMGPRRVLLKSIGLPGRGRGGLLFDPVLVEREFLLTPSPPDISSDFGQGLLSSLGSYGWAEEGGTDIGLTIQVVDDLVELLELGQSFGEQIPERVETRAEALAAMARIWVGCHPDPMLVSLSRRVTTFGAAPDLIAPESHTTEFKAGFEWDPKLKRINGHLRHSLLKAVAGMLNSEGGCIWLGVNDAGQAVGLEREASRLGSRRPMETLELRVRNYLRHHIPATAWCVSAEQVRRKGRCLLKLTVLPSTNVPVYVSVKNPTTGASESCLFIRSGPQTVRLSESDQKAWLVKFSRPEPRLESPTGDEQPPCQP